MTLQLGMVTLIVFAAASYLAWASWRSLRSSKRACGGGGCACSGSTNPAQTAKSDGLIPSDQLMLRRRDGGAG
jgi:threonine/homoserine/homoserine lactone efflux protein